MYALGLCRCVCMYLSPLWSISICQPVPGVMNITSVKKKTSFGALCSENFSTTAVTEEPLASSFITTSPGTPSTPFTHVTCDCYTMGCTVNVTSTGNPHIVTCDNNVAKIIPCGGDLLGNRNLYGESIQYKHKLCTSPNLWALQQEQFDQLRSITACSSNHLLSWQCHDWWVTSADSKTTTKKTDRPWSASGVGSSLDWITSWKNYKTMNPAMTLIWIKYRYSQRSFTHLTTSGLYCETWQWLEYLKLAWQNPRLDGLQQQLFKILKNKQEY